MVFRCPQCAQDMTVDDSARGQTVCCPSCSTYVPVPAAGLEASGAPPPKFCPRCGTKNLAHAARCARCDLGLLAVAPPQFVPAGDGGMGTLIPAKNPMGLLAYYTGLFSIIPCLGLPLGVVALVSGIKGVRLARAHPEVKGGIHAWVGIIFGGISTLVHVVLIVLIAVAASQARKK